MTAVIKNKVAVFRPKGFIDASNASSLITLGDTFALEKSDINMVLISLKKVAYFNKNGLNIFINLLDNLRKKKKNINIGFCDVTVEQYHLILKFFSDNMNFCVFKTLEIAYLFANDNNDHTNRDILIWDSDTSQSSLLAIELFNRGYNPVVATSEDDFNLKKKLSSDFYSIVEHTQLALLDKYILARVKGNSVIYTLTGFLDVSVKESFDLSYFKNCLSVGFTLFIFEASKVISINAHVVAFLLELLKIAFKYGANIAVVGLNFKKIPVKFKDNLEEEGLLLFSSLDELYSSKDLLDSLSKKPASSSSKVGINKVLASQLAVFVNATVITLEAMTGDSALKKSVKVQALEILEPEKKVASAIGLHGTLNGMIMLIFSKEIAKEACKLLLGEEDLNEEIVFDALGEFVNIIGGKVKMDLKNNNHKVQITLPRTFYNVKELQEICLDAKGIQVDLSFGQDSFSLFLIK